MSFTSFRRVWPGQEKGIVAVLLMAIALLTSYFGLLAPVDHLVFDLGQAMGRQKVADDVLIVAVDEESISRIGRWPWPRAVHARLLNIVCAARPAAIGLDIAFSELSDRKPGDSELVQATAHCGNVVLPLAIETPVTGRPMVESPPFPELVAVAAGLGRVGVRLDENGMARSIDLHAGVGAAAWPLFAEELLRVGRGEPARPTGAGAPGYAYGRAVQDTRQLRFSGPPGTIPRISFAQVLEGNVPPEVFAGKTILVGVTAIGLGDLLPTPVSARGMPMPGVEVQANIWLALRDGRLVSPTTAPVSALLCALLSLLPLLWLARLAPLPGLLVSILWVFVLALVCAVLPELCNFWFDPAGALFSGLCAFPTWSWRRLETARRHFDQELRQLGESLSGHGPNPAREVERMGFEQRIAWLEAAQNRLQELDMQRKEALAFISHDMRSPLANAIQQLESRPVCQSAKLLPSLRRAQAMAQAFLSLARAEALEPGQLKELELAAVLHQAADEVYPLAQQRGQPICRVSLDRPVWVDGDFDSLERCAINLLQNASTYAPANSPIRLGLDRYPGGVRFWVENVGDELGAEQLDRLFKRFSRVESGVGKTGGTGLGLYYVRTVAEKHGGQVGVQWSQGVIRFWVSLPR